jgi:hypothetical protein
MGLEVHADEEQTDAFRRWYISRVLTRGNADDLRSIGLKTIYVYFPDLDLPANVRRFWQWYFDLIEVKNRYDPNHSLSTKNRYGD